MPLRIIPNVFAAIAFTLAMSVSRAEPLDGRHSFGLSEAERVGFLAEMRRMPASIQGIVAGIGSEDRGAIAQAAQLSGNRMARATPPRVRAKLP